MCKIKLKNVPTGTSGECDGTLLDSPDILSDSGIIDGSGDVGGSGNVGGSGDLNGSGYLEIISGRDLLTIGAKDSAADSFYFQFQVSWDSGFVSLPLPDHSDGGHVNPCVNVDFELIAYEVGGTAYPPETAGNAVIVKWRTPLMAELSIPFEYYPEIDKDNGTEENPMPGVAYYVFSIPYIYHASKPSLPDKVG